MTDRKSKARKRRGRGALMVAIAAGAVMAFGASSARAADVPLSTEFDNAYLKLGGLEFDILDDPDTAELDGTIDDATGDFTGATLTVPPFSGEVFSGVNVEVTLTADPIAGNVNLANGQMTSPPVDFTAQIVLSGFFSADCTIETPFGFSTAEDYPSPYKGDSFDAPVDLMATPPLTNGALVTTWEALPPATPAPGDDCSLIDGLTNSRGGLWIAEGLAAPTATQPPSDPSTGGGGTAAAPAPTPAKKKKCKKGFKKVKVKGKVKCKKKGKK